MKRLTVVLLMSLASASAFAADTPPAATTPATPAAAPAAPKMICRTEQDTGSRMSKRVCKSADQIKADKEAGKSVLETGQRRLQDVKAGG